MRCIFQTVTTTAKDPGGNTINSMFFLLRHQIDFVLHCIGPRIMKAASRVSEFWQYLADQPQPVVSYFLAC